MIKPLEPSDIEKAMSDAILLANAQGVSDPESIKQRMDQARNEVVREYENQVLIEYAREQSTPPPPPPQPEPTGEPRIVGATGRASGVSGR